MLVIAIIAAAAALLISNNRNIFNEGLKLTHSKASWRSNVMKAGGLADIMGEDWADNVIEVTFLDSLDKIDSNAIDISEEEDGSVMLWYTTNNGKHTAYIGAEGGINGRAAAKCLFYGCYNLKNINFNNNFYTNDTDSMIDMFFGCTSLTKLDLSGFVTSNVSDMVRMFCYCKSLTKLDLSGFVTSNVMDMGYTFYGCKSLTELDLSGFDTSNVTDMTDMFYNCPLIPEAAKLRTN